MTDPESATNWRTLTSVGCSSAIAQVYPWRTTVYHSNVPCRSVLLARLAFGPSWPHTGHMPGRTAGNSGHSRALLAGTTSKAGPAGMQPLHHRSSKPLAAVRGCRSWRKMKFVGARQRVIRRERFGQRRHGFIKQVGDHVENR